MVDPLRIPPPLKEGDAVAVIAPARFATEGQITQAIDRIESWGLKAVVHPSTHARDGQFGGDDRQRSEAFNDALRDPNVRALWAIRGGYGCTRLLPYLDQEALLNDPKWLVGFSDVTALHGWASNLGVASLHGPVLNTMDSTDPEDLRAMRDLLFTSKPSFHQGNRRVVGGNLSVLYALCGTPHMPPLDGRWLLVEDLDEYLYHIDRMLVSLKLAGVFQQVEGLMLGSFLDLKDNTIACGQSVDNPFGNTVEDMVRAHVSALGIPVEWDVPSGHGSRNLPLVLG